MMLISLSAVSRTSVSGQPSELDQAQYRIYMTGTAAMLELFREKLEDLVGRQIKVVLITEPGFELDEAIIYHSSHIEAGRLD